MIGNQSFMLPQSPATMLFVTICRFGHEGSLALLSIGNPSTRYLQSAEKLSLGLVKAWI
jgi:hypothetical protein